MKPIRRNLERVRFPKRQCPICSGAESKPLFRQTFEQLSVARLLDGYEVVICAACGAGFADDIPEQQVFDEYYRDLSKYDHANYGEPHAVGQGFEDIAAILENYIPAGHSRILEIGSASGQLLKSLRDRGYSEVLGADPSPACIRSARDLYGIPGIAATIFTLPEPEEPYDFLILTGVMEHIRDLNRTVERFHGLLRESGRVYLEVPDASRYTPCADAPFQEFSVEHINFFSMQSLINLMQLRGFRALASGHAIRLHYEITTPTTYAVFERTSKAAAIEPDSQTETGLRAYIEGCGAEDARIRSAIERAFRPGERIIVWGVGAHTLRLLATSGLNPANIALFVDSNPKYQRQDLSGIPVVHPEELRNRPEPILISSRGFQREIHNQIRDGLGLMNPVILLYE
jgi:SAM-dependent methyltransferase